MTSPPTRSRSRRRHALVAVAVLVGLALLAGLGVALSAPSGAVPVRPPEHYVALGDSYAAGPGIPSATGVPVTCGRSTANYPSVVRDRIVPAVFRDVSCGGATTADMTTPQPTRAGVNPPQLDALTRDTTLVTLTVGGNDIGFSQIVDQCLARSPSQPGGAACRAYYRQTGRDLLAARIAATAPKLAGVLRQITQRAPGARVLVVGYPMILPTGAGCAEGAFSAGDIAYLNQIFGALNDMLEQQAAAAHARFVDTARASVGHDICAPPDARWVEGRDPSSPAAAFHPNALGMRNVAELVLGALRGP